MALLAARIGEVVAVAAAEVPCARRAIALAHAPRTRLPVLHQRTEPPPAPAAVLRPGPDDGAWIVIGGAIAGARVVEVDARLAGHRLDAGADRARDFPRMLHCRVPL